MWYGYCLRSVKRKVDNAFNVIEAGLGTVRAGLRIARMGTGAGFETAERLSNSIHPKIEEGVKQAAAYGAAAGSLLGFENTAMAIFRQILALNRNLCDAHHRYPLIDHQRSTMC